MLLYKGGINMITKFGAVMPAASSLPGLAMAPLVPTVAATGPAARLQTIYTKE